MDDTYKKLAHTMRLDTYLVREKLIASRSRAQRAIKSGFVTVDGRTVVKASFDIKRHQVVTVGAAADRPAGYWKLRGIQEAFELIKTGDAVLDIGASAGGFAWYAAELAHEVYAVEFSSSCKPFLEAVAGRYPGQVTLIYADAFSFDFGRLGVRFDVLLNDITAEPADALKLLAKLSAVLKTGGLVLQVFKGKVAEQAVGDLMKRIEDEGFKIVKLFSAQKDELYVIAQKKRDDRDAEEGI
jgi:23S rRNA (cytidine1920-2'-O)/16S rRNA (cytidine1409-2'-O)-methyltransferase